jgi:REP element-mobilizing transposase RayT
MLALAIMPDHVHLVLDPADSGHDRPRVLNNLKGVASRRVFQECPDLKLDLHSEHLWADEYQAKLLADPGAVVSACRYVEQNSGKAGLAKQRYFWITPTRPAL